jgi:hypothetical protein
MIEYVAHEKFYKDVLHDSLHPAVRKDSKASHTGSSASPPAAPSRTTHSGGAPNSNILKMLQGIFATCRHTNQHMDVMDHRL